MDGTSAAKGSRLAKLLVIGAIAAVAVGTTIYILGRRKRPAKSDGKSDGKFDKPAADLDATAIATLPDGYWEDLSTPDRIKLASKARSAGNERFYESDYQTAIKCYTTSIAVSP